MAQAAAHWIKLKTDIWGDDEFKLIEAMPDRDAILVVWFKLITHAGKSNANGQLMVNDFIPVEPDMLEALINRPKEIIDRALAVFTKFGMLELVDGGIEIANWHDFVNEDAMAKLKAENARRVREHRERKAQEKEAKKDGNVTSNVTGNGHKKEKEKEKEKEKSSKPLVPDKPEQPASEPDPVPYKEIIDYLNEICTTAFKYAEGHKKWIRARWSEGHRLADFKHVIDVKFQEWGTVTRGKDNRIYLRPETLFGTKFDGYRQQKLKGVKGGGSNGNAGSATGEGLGKFVIE